MCINITGKVKDSAPNRVDSSVPGCLNEESTCFVALESIPYDSIDLIHEKNL